MIKDTMKYCPILGCIGWVLDKPLESDVFEKENNNKYDRIKKVEIKSTNFKNKR